MPQAESNFSILAIRVEYEYKRIQYNAVQYYLNLKLVWEPVKQKLDYLGE